MKIPQIKKFKPVIKKKKSVKPLRPVVKSIKKPKKIKKVEKKKVKMKKNDGKPPLNFTISDIGIDGLMSVRYSEPFLELKNVIKNPPLNLTTLNNQS